MDDALACSRPSLLPLSPPQAAHAEIADIATDRAVAGRSAPRLHAARDASQCCRVHSGGAGRCCLTGKMSDEGESEAAVTNTWEVVLLPLIRKAEAAQEQSVDQFVAAMLLACSTRFDGRHRSKRPAAQLSPFGDDDKAEYVPPPLRYLAYKGPCMPSVLDSVARLTSLVTVDLDAARAPSIDFSALFHPTSFVPRLPPLLTSEHRSLRPFPSSCGPSP